MSLLGVGRARTEVACWLATSRFGALVRGALLATFSAGYAFSPRGGQQRRGLWVAVIQELRVAASLIFLVHLDLSVPWCPEVLVFDASPWGGERG